ncbi:MAG: hypothetical protein J6W06_11670 [Bacteroidales bacterium]|nr:hypothetical protein [Bacteroidales bacterium]
MKKDEFIIYCRFYHGEDTCPKQFLDDKYNGFGLFYWEAEELFCNRCDEKFLQESLRSYMMEGLTNTYPDIPLELAVCLFATYSHAMGNEYGTTGKDFKCRFMPKYLAQPL